ncbi:MAG: DUF1273 family protein [Clostridia bacterium]|nr:DUF1273 family protein [Clostridia bacterium]
MEDLSFCDKQCFFTGHRTIPSGDLGLLSSAVDEEIERCYALGFRTFICGGAVGFDTLAACRVAVARKRHGDIELFLVLPCRNQTERWKDSRDVAVYQRLKGMADRIMYTSETYTSGCMHLRNRTMADMSDHCIAYYNNSGRGGTAYTVRYATEQGKTVTNLHDVIKMQKLQ